MKPIEQEFAANGVVRGAVLMLRPQHALDMVRRCRERGIRVLGLDAFRLTPTTTQPVMEQSIDLCRPGASNDAWSRAGSFLAEHIESDLHFEVVIGNTVEIYMPLLDEGVDVRRPVRAEHLHDNVYRIAIQPYDRANELWAFEPGDVVLCENVEADEGPLLCAIKRAT